MDNFDWSPPEIDIPVENFQEETDEIDVQPRLLKKRAKKPALFYVEYDKFNNSIIAITPEYKDSPGSIRNSVFTTDNKDLVERILNGRVPLNKVGISYNKETKTRELIVKSNYGGHAEFDYVFATRSDEPAPIHITCDIVFKNIIIDVHYDILKQYLSADEFSEYDLEQSNAHINLFCVDRTDKTRLFDNININIFELCSSQRITKKCFWLPHTHADFDKLGFLYYNNGMPITFSMTGELEEAKAEKPVNKPQLIYKQTSNGILLQSVMEFANNYKINDFIELYIFDLNDPTLLYGKRKIAREELNNFNLIELDESIARPVKIITDHHHIHIEDVNVSTYYRI